MFLSTWLSLHCFCRCHLFQVHTYFSSVDSPRDSVPLPPFVVDSTIDDDSSSVVEQNLPRLLQVYRRRQRPPQARPSYETSTDSPTLDLNVPFTIRKDKRSTTTHPISYFVSYDHLSPSFRSFALSISTEFIPRNY